MKLPYQEFKINTEKNKNNENIFNSRKEARTVKSKDFLGRDSSCPFLDFQFSPIDKTMPTSSNIIQNPPLAMDIQDPDPLANSLVLDFLIRNSFNDIASELQKISGTHENLEIHHGGLKLEQLMLDLMDDLFAKSIVYDFLRRTAHAKIAFEFKLHYGPFKDLNGLTLEELFGLYNKK